MARTFITRAEIDRLADAGELLLEVDSRTTVTDLARERARERGLRIVARDTAGATPGTTGSCATEPNVAALPAEQRAEVRAAVVGALGREPDGLDAAIERVLRRRG
ncbi:hypothetical protein [Actinotalea sp. K2]|uniref:hypothetical protein n=1 Tax=Actinotalea sp. K2 TaxID=2939438 RepID=UPI002016C266|nr:hypothetical protein [Actinotalea sp. K2]MCL3859788.1 hypothetical protein [Actinotalea sp. K2]